MPEERGSLQRLARDERALQGAEGGVELLDALDLAQLGELSEECIAVDRTGWILVLELREHEREEVGSAERDAGHGAVARARGAGTARGAARSAGGRACVRRARALRRGLGMLDDHVVYLGSPAQ